MKILLQNHMKFLEVGKLDTVSGSFQTFEKKGLAHVKSGSYSYYKNDLLVIYIIKDNLTTKIGAKEIPINANISAILEKFDTHNVMKIFDDGKEIFSYKYIPEKEVLDDMTPFIDEEDNDFLLFITNIINSPERQEVFREINRDCQ